MGLSGLGRLKGWQAGRAASSLSTRSLQDWQWAHFLKIRKARSGPPAIRFLARDSANFRMTAPGAVATRSLDSEGSAYGPSMKIVEPTFGWEDLTVYGVGNLAPQNIFRYPAILTAFKVWLRRMTAPF